MSGFLIDPYFFVSAGIPGTPFVTGQTIGNVVAGSSSGYYTGFAASAGGSDIVVTAIGWYKHAGNSQVHNAKILDGSNVEVASCTIDMSQAPDADGYVYGAINYTIPASTNFRIVVEDVTGDDRGDVSPPTSVTTTAVASVAAAYYWLNSGSNGAAYGGAYSYGPANFKYSSP